MNYLTSAKEPSGNSYIIAFTFCHEDVDQRIILKDKIGVV